MADQNISAEQMRAITAFVDIEASPPDERPTAHLIFGTNQAKPAEIVAQRYHRGLAPLIIATGGINRHNGITEGREFYRLLVERGVPDIAIRVEDQSANTWQNVEFALPFLREALNSGLPITAVCKWFHRRAAHSLKTLVHDISPFYVITWEPSYGGRPVTRTDWPLNPDGKRRVLREWKEILRRVSEGSFKDASYIGSAWR